MALAYSSASALPMMDALGGAHDEAGSVKARLEFLTSLDALVIACEFATDAFAAAAIQGTPPSAFAIISANTIAQGEVQVGNGGTITKAQAVAPNGDVLWAGTVTNLAGSGDIKLTEVAFAVREAGQPGSLLNITAMNLSMPVGVAA